MKLSVYQTGFFILIAAVMVFLFFGSSSALDPEDLTELSIEELAEIEVTSVSRKPQKLSQAAAAIFVITGEDIRRSGATSIPELLRMVPGIHVAKISSSKWAVTSRGFNSRYANKLLVQLDGRTLYSPLFSGVFWETQDTMFEDIERIEVVRGPGASLWGANAVNGIINIITKHTSETKGGLVYGGGGTWERAFGGIRYGGSLSENTSCRIYSRYSEFADVPRVDGSGADDEWHRKAGGFRADFNLFSGIEATLQGDLYDGKTKESSNILTYSPPYSIHYENKNDMSGYNLLGRIRLNSSVSSDTAVQFYYDNFEREESTVRWTGELFDFDFQHRFLPLKDHELIFGMGYRHYQDDIGQNIGFRFSKEREKADFFSAFIQDSIILSEALRLVLGAKFEHNDYTGYEFQPGSRISWSPDRSHHFWAAVSRAVRTPDRADNSVSFSTAVIPPGTPENPGPLPASVAITGNEDVESEELTAFETGYRVIPLDNLSIDATVFYYIYTSLSGFTMGTPYTDLQTVPAHSVIPLNLNNKMKGKTRGAELAVSWCPVAPTRFQAAYSWFDMEIETGDASMSYSENDSPSHQFSLRSMFDFPGNLSLDIWFRFVDEILGGRVEGYSELDMRTGWSPLESVEVSVACKNLLESRHPEYIESFQWSEPTEIERSLYGKISIKF